MTETPTRAGNFCVINHGHDKYGVARVAEATHGRLCRNHAKRLNEWIRDIAVDFSALDTRLSPMKSSGDYTNDGRGSGDEARAPLNLAVVALRDAERAWPARDRADIPDEELPDLDIPSVVAVVHNRAEDLRVILDPQHEADPSIKDVNLDTEVRLLLNGSAALYAAEWVDEAFVEFKQVWVALQSAHARPRPKAVGNCLSVDCGGKVWPRFGSSPWCSTCHRVYDTEVELIKARIEQEQRELTDTRETA